MPPITARQFDDEFDLPDWRFLLGRIEALFVAETFDDAVGFVGGVAAAAISVQRHPNIDIHHPSRVRITLGHDDLTSDDAELAAELSRIATSSRVVSRPSDLTRLEIAIDALDIRAVRPFWQAVLGYEADPAPEGRPVTALHDPQGTSPAVWFQQMEQPRGERNRLHIDISVPHDVAEARIDAALQAGGRLVSDRAARAFWVLADAEGNEACISTWQDRD